MSGLVIGKKEIEIPISVVNYLDEPKYGLKMGEDMRYRHTKWVRSIIVHTTKGLPIVVKPGKGPDTNLEERIARLWATDGRNAGAHLSIDWDLTICCHCDLLKIAAYHGGVINEVSIGIEMFQGSDGTVYEDQLLHCVKLVDSLTEIFRIQRQIPSPTTRGLIPRLASGGKDCVGVFGHRHVTNNRGPGDPGDEIFERLMDHGYIVLNFENKNDREVWRNRQQQLLGFPKYDSDGTPGPMTCDALQFEGYPYGLWAPAEKETLVQNPERKK